MSGHHSSSFTRVYIGRLPRDVTEREVEKLAREFGRVRDIRVLAGFAFVEFSDSRDARDCVRELDNSRYDGERLIAQPARSDSDRRDRDSTALRRGEFSISVQGLPPRTSWQDLKDLFRKSGHVVFTNTDANGDGVVEFSNEGDKTAAIEQFDKYDYQGCILSVKENIASGNSNGNGTTGRSPSPRRRSPSPRGRSASPRGRSVSPRGRSSSPKRD
ncbi:hypothetical protein BASA81_016180 [Batrachochytrium salamandrivorans]|nr:hypothetical protein BASA62_000381 [Batrachochytrium salamandrivorans]KAH9246289.1 hypothetical protein BASA81_016180 [Batrachochytrium salamandrivorans]